MKIYIISCDKYSFLLNIHVDLINKYWPEQDIVILGYNLSNLKQFPDNVKTVSLGTCTSDWAGPLIPYFENIDNNEKFIIALDDFILINKVDQEKINLLMEKMNSGEADKVILGNWLVNRSTVYGKDPRFHIVNQEATYRNTIHPSIWTKNYWLKVLTVGNSIWASELSTMSRFYNDGATILSLIDDSTIYDGANIYSRGSRLAPESAGLGWTSDEDKKLIMDAVNSNK